MIEGLKQFFKKISISSELELNRIGEEVDSIFNSGLLQNILTKEETLLFFKESYSLIQQHIEKVNKISNQNEFTQLDENFKRAFDDYYQQIHHSKINKDTLFNFLSQICIKELDKIHLQEITEKYEDFVFKYYSLKSEYLMKGAIKFKQNDKLTNLYQKQIAQLGRDQEEEFLFLNKKRMMRSYLETEQNKQQMMTMELNSQNGNEMMIIDQQQHSDPVLPNIFVNFSLTKSLQQLKDNMVPNNKQTSELTAPKLFILPKSIWNLDSIKEIDDVQKLQYYPISFISNSRINHATILQKILNCERQILMKYTDENDPTKKVYEGDFVGFLDRKNINKNQNVLILTTNGLDDALNFQKKDDALIQKIDEELDDLSIVSLFTNDCNMNAGDGDKRQLPNKVNQITATDKQEMTKLKSVLQLMKKAIVCQFLIETSSTVFVMLQETDQDFALYEQIKLICSNFLKKDEEKEINFIHFYPQIQNVKCSSAQNQYKKIKNRFNFKNQSVNFQNVDFIRFEENEERSNNYTNSIRNKRINFNHFMLFGDFESAYNHQLFKQIKKDIKQTKSPAVSISEIESGMKECIDNSLKTFFQISKDNLQFKEQPTKKIKTEKNKIGFHSFKNDHIYWKDLILFPSCFITSNPIQEEIDENE